MGEPVRMCASPGDAAGAMMACLGPPGMGRGAAPVALGDAPGMILAEAARADRDSPAFDQSAMDGYAVRCRDLLERCPPGVEEVDLAVTDESRIGHAPPSMPMTPGAVRIATGAPVPGGAAGADAVVRREDVREVFDERGHVSSIKVPAGVARGVRHGQHIRPRAGHCRRGDVVVPAGQRLMAPALGVLASVGVTRPVVFERLRVSILTTGDEVVPPQDTPAPFQIRDSNAPGVAATLAAHPWLRVASCRHEPDDPARVLAAIRGALGESDAIVLIAGVSAGHRDPVRPAIERAGGQIVFHGVRQRPGKPMLGATIAGRVAGGASRGAGAPKAVPVFGLPGNPVSALVTCVRVVLPVLAHAAGLARWAPPPMVRPADWDERTLDMWWHRPVRLAGSGQAHLLPNQGSGDLASLAGSDGFVEVPPDWTPRDHLAGSWLAFHGWSG